MPLALSGNVVRDLELRFEGGRAVEVSASSGADLIREQLRQDDNACMLGEVALVDGDSRVGRSGLVFLNTLFDENASCHIAYGAGILDAIADGDGKSEAELESVRESVLINTNGFWTFLEHYAPGRTASEASGWG